MAAWLHAKARTGILVGRSSRFELLFARRTFRET